MTRTLDEISGEDTIETGDLTDRLNELESQPDDEIGLDEEEIEERDKLRSICEDGEQNISEWNDGATLVRDSYFEDYARQLAEDIGAIESDGGWPNSYIDWGRACDALKMDYSEVEIDGYTYYGRA